MKNAELCTPRGRRRRRSSAGWCLARLRLPSALGPESGRRVVVLAVAALPLLANPLSAQSADRSGATRSREREPAQALARGRKALEAFEDLRRSKLPYERYWPRERCDVAIGRMCWRYHEGRARFSRFEPLAVTAGRDSLLGVLERAAQAAPGDAWILGQRIFYLLEAGRVEEARELAARCGAIPPWRCSALEGLTLHVQGRYAAAGRAFDEALGTMDPGEARRWTDVTPLLDGELSRLLDSGDEMTAAGRDALVQRLWRLADPLYIVPGNDRLTEHLARRVLIEIVSEGNSPYRIPWGDDMGELVLRYGWEQGWVRVPPRSGELGAPVRIVGYQHPDLRRFVPPASVLSDPTEPVAAPWTPFMWATARSGYSPAYAPVFLPMQARTIILTRGESSLVAATFELPADTTWRTREGIREPHVLPATFRGLPVQAALVLMDPDGQVLRAAREIGAERGVLILETPAGEYLSSLEVLAPGAGRAGRLRNGLSVRVVPPDVPVLSELLVIRGDSLPADTDEALERLRLDDRIVSGEAIVVAWELWGPVRSGDALAYRLRLEPTDPGLLGRIRNLFGGERGVPVLEWQESGLEGPGPAFRSTSMAIPELPAGEYVLRLEVTLPGRSPLMSEQRLRIVGPDEGAREDAP